MMDESAEAPSNQQLVDGSVATVAQMPAAAFPLADMLVSLCGQDSGKNKQQVFKGLVQHLTHLGAPQVIASHCYATPCLGLLLGPMAPVMTIHAQIFFSLALCSFLGGIIILIHE